MMNVLRPPLSRSSRRMVVKKVVTKVVKQTRPRVVTKKIRRAVTIRMTISRWYVGDDDKR